MRRLSRNSRGLVAAAILGRMAGFDDLPELVRDAAEAEAYSQPFGAAKRHPSESQAASSCSEHDGNDVCIYMHKACCITQAVRQEMVKSGSANVSLFSLQEHSR